WFCEAVRQEDTVRGSVRAMRYPISDPVSQVSQTSSAVTFELDTLHHLMLIEGDTDPTRTACGMLVDMLNMLRGRYQ
ncbi:MAG: hypothetical protein K8S97_05470, partial [Anaerolineae bacterium]|nr:hypothetical protein [Anaerolineae bacterium]